MPTPIKTPPVTRTFRDLGVSTALSASGFPAQLDNRNGVVVFCFSGDPDQLDRIEREYWSGALKLSVRDVVMSQRVLKDRLYAQKDMSR